MLAEENKNSGRSALDGELTLSARSQTTVHSHCEILLNTGKFEMSESRFYIVFTL